MTGIGIAGMACRYPDADTPRALWENVLAQRRAFRRLPPARLRAEDYLSADPSAPDRTYTVQAAVLEGWDFDRVRFRVSGSAFRAADLVHWLALEVAADALADAGLADGTDLDRERTIVVVGNTLTGEFSRARALRLRWPYVRRLVASALNDEGVSTVDREHVLAVLEHEFKTPLGTVDEETLAGSLSNTIAGRICNAFDLKGGGYTVDGACASSLLAVATAATALERGDADVAIAGGVDLSLDPFELVGFAKAGALARDDMRVYDDHSQGFWPGEGCGFVVLQRLDDTVEPIVALRGWGVSSDGAGGITRPERDGQLLALQRAYARAPFDIASVQLFEGHGTGTPTGDATELEALNLARAEAGATRRAAIGSVKANIGHTKAAAGVAGLIKATLSLHDEVIPPTTGCLEPHELLRRADGTLRVTTEPETWPADTPRRAAVSAMGFGGVNAHVVLERVAAPHRRSRLRRQERILAASAQDAELYLFAGRTDDVARSVTGLLAVAETLSLAELADACVALRPGLRPAEADVRAALVAATPDELKRGLVALDASLRRDDRLTVAADDLFVGRGAPARVGYLFTGQGTGIVDGGALGRRFECVRKVFAGLAPAASADPVETSSAQPAIVTASLAGLELLRRLRVKADVAVGHSLGELTALHWAGALDAGGVVALAAARGRAMSERGDRNGAMASVAADAETTARLSADADVVIAGLNGPRQTVVSGPSRAVAQIVDLARAAGIGATFLSVSHAFHSPLVAAAAEPLEAYLSTVEFATLSRCVMSTVSGDELHPSVDLGALLLQQLTSPVRFAEALDRAAACVDLFVEVGPGRVLTDLANGQVNVPAVALQVGGVSLRPTLAAVGALFAAGALGDPRLLYDGRFVRPFSIDSRRRFLANPCEAAPLDRAPEPILRRTPEDVAPSLDGDALAIVRRLVADRAELPLSAISDNSRLLGDLHLSSIAVGEIAARAARQLGSAPPTASGELATATVAGLAAALERLAETAPVDESTTPAGIGAWLRPFERILADRPATTTGIRVPTRWHVVGPAGASFVDAVKAAFAGNGDETGVVVALPDRRDRSVPPHLAAAAELAREHGVDRFAVVERGEVAGAFARVVHLEQALPTCVVGVERDVDLTAARYEAESTPTFAEVRFDSHGRRRMPLLRALTPTRGVWPLAAGDLIVATGGGKGIVAECALGLARRHAAALLILGRADPERDGELADNLARFEAAGVRFAYARADVCDAEAVRVAISKAASAWGPVRGILHGAGSNEPALLEHLDLDAFARTLAPKIDGLENVLAAVDPAGLGLLATFGSIIGAIGLRGEAHYALANHWLRLALEDAARRAPGCRCVDVAWSIWAGTGMGERLGTVEALARVGVDAIPIEAGTRLLDELICAEQLPASVVATGRFGLPATVELERPERPLLRFVERALLEYPGVELVAEADISLASDPYLADHALDRVPLLPAALGLEAMAQAATTLLGTAPTSVEDVSFERPVTVPADGIRRIRIAARSRGDGTVDAALRSDESGFQVDHFRMSCRTAAAPTEDATVTAMQGDVRLRPEQVYDALLFHGPRFRRVRRYRALRARQCVAEVEARQDAWFAPFLPARLLLGDPGVTDAVMHALQACIPGERVLPVGIGRLELSRAIEGPATVIVSATERSADDRLLTWDVDVSDARGAVVQRWRGLRLQRVGDGGPVPTRWPVPLLVPYLERRIAALTLRDVALAVKPCSRRARSDRAIAAAVGADIRVRRRFDGKPEVDGQAVSASHVDGFMLAVAGDGVVACDVESVTARGDGGWNDLLGRDRLELASAIADATGEQLDMSAARVWAAGECTQKSGRARTGPLTLVTSSSDGWVLLRADAAPIATYVGQVAGEAGPLAFAFLAEGSS